MIALSISPRIFGIPAKNYRFNLIIAVYSLLIAICLLIIATCNLGKISYIS